jgi:S1-C subfamily serine protease
MMTRRMEASNLLQRAAAAHEPPPKTSDAVNHTQLGDSRTVRFCHDAAMATDLLASFSNQLADAVAAAAPSVVQVQGRRRPASGLVYADNVVLTTVRALGRGDTPQVRRGDGRTLNAELAGWDATTGLAVLRVPGLETPPTRDHGATRSPRAPASCR